MAEYAALVAAGAVLALDHAAWPSLLISQPLVAGALTGAVLGHVEAGLAAGAVVQMLGMRVQPVGGAAVPEAWLGGVAAALCAPADLALRGGVWLDDGRLAAPAAVGVLAMLAGRAALVVQRRLQARLASAVMARVERGETAGISQAQAVGVALHACRGAILAGLVVLLARPLASALAAGGLVAPAGRLALALAAVSLGHDAIRRRRRWGVVAGAIAGLLAALAGTG